MEESCPTYSSTVKTLASSQDRQAASSSSRAVLVRMEHTAGHAALPYATLEVEVTKKLCRSMLLTATEPLRRQAEVLTPLLDWNSTLLVTERHIAPIHLKAIFSRKTGSPVLFPLLVSWTSIFTSIHLFWPFCRHAARGRSEMRGYLTKVNILSALSSWWASGML